MKDNKYQQKKLKNSTGSWEGMGYSRIRPRCTALCMNRHKKTGLWVNNWFMTAPF
jgi:hypothetical protein